MAKLYKRAAGTGHLATSDITRRIVSVKVNPIAAAAIAAASG